MFYRLLGKAGLRRIRFYDLPHSYASPLIQNGESLAYVRDQFGHASIQLTVDTMGTSCRAQTDRPWTLGRCAGDDHPQPSRNRRHERRYGPSRNAPSLLVAGAHNPASAR